MSELFDRAKWHDNFSHPNWHRRVNPDWHALRASWEEIEGKGERETAKRDFYQFVEAQLAAGDVVIGEPITSFDEQRQPISKVILHHTKEPGGIAATRLNAMHLINIYALYFCHPNPDTVDLIKDSPVFSGHFMDGEQVFQVFHWLVREDGRAERLLDDKYTGWHAANWQVNCQSVAIAFDGDLTSARPSETAIKGAAKLIKDHYPQVELDNILGVLEVNPNTESPGRKFLGPDGWKKDLLSALK